MITLLRIIALSCPLFAFQQAFADTMVMPGEVISGHAKLEADCSNCHKKFDKAAQSRLCVDCHKGIGRDLASKRGYHGRLDPTKECRECHTEHKGRNARIAAFDHRTFDHNQTDYPLKGGHLKPRVKCADCHKPGRKYRDAPTECNACHRKDDKHKGALGTNCSQCHQETNWKSVAFDHEKTKFPLLGKHASVKCEACHRDDRFKDTPVLCNACHKKDDRHHGRLGPKCESCHVERSWKEIRFNHEMTKFPLLGKHQGVACDKCHIRDTFKRTPTLCNACHRKEGEKAHKGKFGNKCESCHVERSWKAIRFDHDRQTKYPLLGKHRQVQCAECHKGDIYREKLPTQCNACHKKDDKHRGQEGARCETCHKEASWTVTTFDHGLMSTYPLLGRHLLVPCKRCHATAMFKNARTDCWSCHQKDDRHKRTLGSECQTCHNTRDWKAWDFNHDKTGFRLNGPHAKVAGNCYACHYRPTYGRVLAPTDCESCHDKDDVHNGTYGDRCDRCHNGNDWKQVRIGVLSTRKH